MIAPVFDLLDELLPAGTPLSTEVGVPVDVIVCVGFCLFEAVPDTVDAMLMNVLSGVPANTIRVQNTIGGVRRTFHRECLRGLYIERIVRLENASPQSLGL